MSKQQLSLWLKVVTIILMAFGAFYYLYGFTFFTDAVKLVPRSVLVDWEAALYGAVLFGWGITLFLLGRLAFNRDDKELKRILFIGLVAWLALEAIATIRLGVWFDAGVDVAVAALFAVPLLRNANKD